MCVVVICPICTSRSTAYHVALQKNAPTLREISRSQRTDDLDHQLRRRRQAVTLDIDDTCDVAHGHQQLLRLSTSITMSVAFF